jgi:hypothetical protein
VISTAVAIPPKSRANSALSRHLVWSRILSCWMTDHGAKGVGELLPPLLQLPDRAWLIKECDGKAANLLTAFPRSMVLQRTSGPLVVLDQDQ